MIQFIKDDWFTVIIVLIIAVCVLLAIRKIIRDKKSGKGPCGGYCAECGKECEHNKNKQE